MRKLNQKPFVNLVKLQYLNLSHNKLSNLDSESFSKQDSLRTLDLSANELKKLNANILPSRTSQLELLAIGNNQLRELIGFKDSNLTNVKIMGIDSNKINCTHFEHIFEYISWNHFHSFSTRINCSSHVEDDEQITETSSTTQMPTEGLKHTGIDFHVSRSTEDVEMLTEKPKSDSKLNISVQENHSTVDDHHNIVVEHLIKLTWLNTIILVVILVGVALHCSSLKTSENVHMKRAHYQRDEVTLLNATENHAYDVINEK